jgi:signal transduction histidine kinase
VRDNGSGPATAQPDAPACHGLRMLRERARYLGGSMTLAPAPGGGSALSVTLPRHGPARA